MCQVSNSLYKLINITKKNTNMTKLHCYRPLYWLREHIGRGWSLCQHRKSKEKTDISTLYRCDSSTKSMTNTTLFLSHCWRLGDNQSVESSVPVISRWLWPGHRTFLEVGSTVLIWWIVAFLCSVWHHAWSDHHMLSSSCKWPGQLSGCMSSAIQWYLHCSLLYCVYNIIQAVNLILKALS